MLQRVHAQSQAAIQGCTSREGAQSTGPSPKCRTWTQQTLADAALVRLAADRRRDRVSLHPRERRDRPRRAEHEVWVRPASRQADRLVVSALRRVREGRNDDLLSTDLARRRRLWVPETRPGILSRRFARRDRIRGDAARPLPRQLPSTPVERDDLRVRCRPAITGVHGRRDVEPPLPVSPPSAPGRLPVGGSCALRVLLRSRSGRCRRARERG